MKSKFIIMLLLSMTLISHSVLANERELTDKLNEYDLDISDEISIGGIIYEIKSVEDEEILVSVSGVEELDVTNIYIPKEVKYKDIKFTVAYIGKKAFYGLNKLTKVVSYANLISIENLAFYKNKSIKLLKLTGKKLENIGKKAFYKLRKTLKVEVPKKYIKHYEDIISSSKISIIATDK